MFVLDLVVTSRIGVRFPERPVMAKKEVENRLELLQATSARSIAMLASLRPLWVIQTDPAHVNTVRTSLKEMPIIREQLSRVHVVEREGEIPSPRHLDRLEFADRFLCLRLDADDYYFEGPLVQALERFQAEPVGTLIDFPRGFLVDLDANRARRFTYSVQGPFYGIITTPDDPIAAIGHHGRAREGRICHEQTQRAWAQTVHSANIVTRYRKNSVRREAKSMIKQMRRARGTRSAAQLLIRPLDLVPLRYATQRRLVDLFTIHKPPLPLR